MTNDILLPDIKSNFGETIVKYSTNFLMKSTKHMEQKMWEYANMAFSKYSSFMCF